MLNMDTLTPYEKLVVEQAILHKMNSIKTAYDKLKECIPVGVKERAKEDYQNLLSAAQKLQLNIDKEIEGLN